MAHSLKDFDLIKKIGDGSYSTVYKVKRKTDLQIFALKKVKLTYLNTKEKENALNEIRFLASLNNPHIIGYKEAFYEESINCLCIVMEFAGGGNLQNYLDKIKKKREYMNDEMVWSYVLQMVQGLKNLHDLKILHRDIKCANIFLSDDLKTVKIGDLNVSKLNKNGLLHTQTGTPYYASPEIWKDMPYDKKSDIWSLGCVIYEMLTFYPPFMANDMKALYNKVQKANYKSLPAFYHTNLTKLIEMCLQKNPLKRANCEEILNFEPIKSLENDIDSRKKELKKEKTYLLDTIKMPKKMGLLKDMLPKPNYNPLEEITNFPQRMHMKEKSAFAINLLPSIQNLNLLKENDNNIENKKKKTYKTPIISNKYNKIFQENKENQNINCKMPKIL